VSSTQTDRSVRAASAYASFVVPAGLVHRVYELRFLANNVFTSLGTSGVLTFEP
jgi:hypothetical protein